MATSGQTTKKFVNDKFSLTFAWSVVSQDAINNTSTISWTLKLSMDSDAYISYDANSSKWSATVNGSVYNGSGSIQCTAGSTLTLLTGSNTITHNDDGSKTFNVSFLLNPHTVAGFNYTGGGSSNIADITGNATYTLPTITLQATILSGENFTDESSPTITYTNPVGTAATSLQACISLTGGTDDIAYRDIPKDGTSYTFTFGSADKNWMWKRLDEGLTSVTMYYRIRTVYDGVTYWSAPYTTKLTLVNYKPTLVPQIYDTNQKTIALTGNRNRLVRYASNAYYTLNAVARKGSTLDAIGISNGGQTQHTQTGTFEAVSSNEFDSYAKDNRGYQTTNYQQFTQNDGYWIPYIPLTCAIKNDPLTAEGYLNVHISGKYWEGYFGAAYNSLSIQYFYSENNGSFVASSKRTVTPTVDEDGNYTYTLNVSGLNYKSQYRIYVVAYDAINSVTSSTIVVAAGEPIFDWSKNDFQFYIPVGLNAGYNAPQTVLWEGALHMNASQSIDLTGKEISKQSNGILLVFSLYRNNAAENASIHSFFISKKVVELFYSGKYPFWMTINNNLSVVGCKYLTISDNKIEGDASNTASGTANGSSITFNNSNFVLRYVIGV